MLFQRPDLALMILNPVNVAVRDPAAQESESKIVVLHVEGNMALRQVEGMPNKRKPVLACFQGRVVVLAGTLGSCLIDARLWDVDRVPGYVG